MRHGCAFRKLSRNSVKRDRMLRNLATNLFIHERIKTTVARGKELHRYAEKLITLAKRSQKSDISHLRTLLFTDGAANKLLGELRNRYAERSGGYTRLWRMGSRKGDKAPMSMLELVDNPWDMRKMFERAKPNFQGRILQYASPIPSPQFLLK